MILQFPNLQERRRASREKRSAPAKARFRSAPAHVALAACRAELLAIARSATLLTRTAAVQAKKSPGRGGPGDRGLNRAWAARKRAQ
jgi:hypothetical protein